VNEEISHATALTFPHSANRAFEVRYWKTIADLAEGRYINKNSGDCVKDSNTQSHLRHSGRDLDLLGDHLLAYYRRLASEAGMEGVFIGDTPFRWQTDFEFPWMGGWLDNQEGRKHERNIVVVIPGKNRNEAVIMADHYDTAYMEDFYGDRPEPISDGSRLAAQGADDNHSATAALMLAAAPFMELSRNGMLDCDIWLVHLTGEEFPSDCLGARHLTEHLVEENFGIRTQDGTFSDLSKTRVRGLYVLDMIAHNNDRHRDIFQIAPGTNRESLWLAYQAHMATRLWQAGTVLWNAEPPRRNLGRATRSPHAVPRMARYLAPQGEVRLHDNPRSTLFNTDGQIFSDAGIPAVLFMENYDINRTGYHDSQDTMANIDLDYGAAVASIAIESVARAAVHPKKP
jgi:Zn-dependent M28 family amino/carboxypeptidase